MIKAKLYANDGTPKSEVELPGRYFEQPIDEHLLHFAVVSHLANIRQGTSKAQNRSEVSHSGKKPWKQKGTGRARSGDSSSPLWVRGAKAHGPRPHKHTVKVNKKVRDKALASALSLKAKEESIHVFEALTFEAPKTKVLAAALRKASLLPRKNLILVPEVDRPLQLSVRNLPGVRVERVRDLNAYDVMNAGNLVFTQAAMNLLAGTGA